jgi:hypothetical protein
MEQFADAEVVGVNDLVHRKICFKCRGTVDELDEIIGVCSRCSLAQRMDRCILGLSAKLSIHNCDADEILTLSASHSIVQKITENDAIDESTTMEDLTKMLLMSKPFTITYTGSLITSVHRDGI